VGPERAQKDVLKLFYPCCWGPEGRPPRCATLAHAIPSCAGPPQYLTPEREADPETKPDVLATVPPEWPTKGDIVVSKLTMRCVGQRAARVARQVGGLPRGQFAVRGPATREGQCKTARN
jgi:hypothetical protein